MMHISTELTARLTRLLPDHWFTMCSDADRDSDRFSDSDRDADGERPGPRAAPDLVESGHRLVSLGAQATLLLQVGRAHRQAITAGRVSYHGGVSDEARALCIRALAARCSRKIDFP